MSILIIDHDPGVRENAVDAVRRMGREATAIEDSPGALSEIQDRPFAMALWHLPENGRSSFNVLRTLRESHPELPVVTFAVSPESTGAVEFIKQLVILADELEPGSRRGSLIGEETDQPPCKPGERVSLEDLEREHIRRIVERTGSLAEAASVLGIDAATLYRKRKRYQITV